jgi:hypothetical protein
MRPTPDVVSKNFLRQGARRKFCTEFPPLPASVGTYVLFVLNAERPPPLERCVKFPAPESATETLPFLKA